MRLAAEVDNGLLRDDVACYTTYKVDGEDLRNVRYGPTIRLTSNDHPLIQQAYVVWHPQQAFSRQLCCKEHFSYSTTHCNHLHWNCIGQTSILKPLNKRINEIVKLNYLIK